MSTGARGTKAMVYAQSRDPWDELKAKHGKEFIMSSTIPKPRSANCGYENYTLHGHPPRELHVLNACGAITERQLNNEITGCHVLLLFCPIAHAKWNGILRQARIVGADILALSTSPADTAAWQAEGARVIATMDEVFPTLLGALDRIVLDVNGPFCASVYQTFSKLGVSQLVIQRGKLSVGDKIIESTALNAQWTVASMRLYPQDVPCVEASAGMHVGVKLETPAKLLHGIVGKVSSEMDFPKLLSAARITATIPTSSYTDFNQGKQLSLMGFGGSAVGCTLHKTIVLNPTTQLYDVSATLLLDAASNHMVYAGQPHCLLKVGKEYFEARIQDVWARLSVLENITSKLKEPDHRSIVSSLRGPVSLVENVPDELMKKQAFDAILGSELLFDFKDIAPSSWLRTTLIEVLAHAVPMDVFALALAKCPPTIPKAPCYVLKPTPSDCAKPVMACGAVSKAHNDATADWAVRNNVSDMLVRWLQAKNMRPVLKMLRDTKQEITTNILQCIITTTPKLPDYLVWTAAAHPLCHLTHPLNTVVSRFPAFRRWALYLPGNGMNVPVARAARWYQFLHIVVSRKLPFTPILLTLIGSFFHA